jgi:hypothetical protein
MSEEETGWGSRQNYQEGLKRTAMSEAGKGIQYVTGQVKGELGELREIRKSYTTAWQ